MKTIVFFFHKLRFEVPQLFTEFGGTDRTRTDDQEIKSLLLCQLSYDPKFYQLSYRPKFKRSDTDAPDPTHR